MSEEEKRILLHAHRKIAELRDNKELFTKLTYSTQFDTDEQKGQFGFKNRPSPNAVKAATADIRHFLMPGSSVVWGRVMKICRKYLPRDKQEDLRKLGKLWSRETGNSGTSLGLGMGLNLNGKPLTRKKLLNLWINGDLFHIDDKESEEIARMRGNPFIGMAELVFIAAIQNLAILLFNLDKRFIEPLLENDK